MFIFNSFCALLMQVFFNCPHTQKVQHYGFLPSSVDNVRSAVDAM